MRGPLQFQIRQRRVERKFRAIRLQRRGGHHCAPVSDGDGDGDGDSISDGDSVSLDDYAHSNAVSVPDANSDSVANSLVNRGAILYVVADPDADPFSDTFFASNANAIAEPRLIFRHLRL